MTRRLNKATRIVLAAMEQQKFIDARGGNLNGYLNYYGAQTARDCEAARDIYRADLARLTNILKGRVAV